MRARIDGPPAFLAGAARRRGEAIAGGGRWTRRGVAIVIVASFGGNGGQHRAPHRPDNWLAAPPGPPLRGFTIR
jgi:hypothetical protein